MHSTHVNHRDRISVALPNRVKLWAIRIWRYWQLGVLIFIIFILTLFQLQHDVRKFRSAPAFGEFKHTFNSQDPLSYAKRFLYLWPGSQAYDRQIRMYIGTKKIAPDFINMYLIQHTIDALPIKQRLEFAREFPAAFRQKDKRLSIAFDATSDSCAIFGFLNEGTIDGETIRHLGFEVAFFECLEQEIVLRTPQNIPAQVVKTFHLFPTAARTFLNELTKIPAHSNNISLLAAYASNRVSGSGTILLAYIRKQRLFLSDEDISLFAKASSDEKMEKLLFDIATTRGQKLVFEIFHRIVHRDLRKAEKLATKILQGEDSSLRKGLIVILVNHNSVIGGDYLDQAFSGDAPRTLQFTSVAKYLYGSEATRQYTYIARHDYLETGKTYPPTYCKPPLDNEIEEWKGFIEHYPWFPGTDDAYYRLAFRQFADGDNAGAKATLEKYRKTTLVDDDVSDLVETLARDIAGVEAGDMRPNFKNVFDLSGCKS